MELTTKELAVVFTTLCYIRKYEQLTDGEEELYQRFMNEGWKDIS